MLTGILDLSIPKYNIHREIACLSSRLNKQLYNKFTSSQVFKPRLSKGCERVQLSNPLGFKHHPLEGAGIYLLYVRFYVTHITQPCKACSLYQDEGHFFARLFEFDFLQ